MGPSNFIFLGFLFDIGLYRGQSVVFGFNSYRLLLYSEYNDSLSVITDMLYLLHKLKFEISPVPLNPLPHVIKSVKGDNGSRPACIIVQYVGAIRTAMLCRARYC